MSKENPQNAKKVIFEKKLSRLALSYQIIILNYHSSLLVSISLYLTEARCIRLVALLHDEACDLLKIRKGSLKLHLYPPPPQHTHPPPLPGRSRVLEQQGRDNTALLCL